MKYLFIDAKNRVSFDDDNYYLNGKSLPNENGDNTAELAKKLAHSKVAETTFVEQHPVSRFREAVASLPSCRGNEVWSLYGAADE